MTLALNPSQGFVDIDLELDIFLSSGSNGIDNPGMVS